MLRQLWASLFLLMGLSRSALAHANMDAGWLHPLSGMDHLLAMISVGAWSSQIGGRAIWIVPSAFVCFMFLGGLAGFEHLELPATEIAVSLSVVLLGLAIALKKRLPVIVAAATTALFGIFHGYAHGYEMPLMDNKVLYTLGFLCTTAMLHIIGAAGGHFLMKNKHGDNLLRLLGASSMFCGIYLLMMTL